MYDSALNQKPVRLPSLARPTPLHRGLLAFAGLKLLVSSLLFLALPSSACAATVTLAWDASPAAVAGYLLYYGSASGSYRGMAKNSVKSQFSTFKLLIYK